MLCLRYYNIVDAQQHVRTWYERQAHKSKKNGEKIWVRRLLNHNGIEKDSPASIRRRRCLNRSSERPDRCQRSPPRKNYKSKSIPRGLCSYCTCRIPGIPDNSANRSTLHRARHTLSYLKVLTRNGTRREVEIFLFWDPWPE